MCMIMHTNVNTSIASCVNTYLGCAICLCVFLARPLFKVARENTFVYMLEYFPLSHPHTYLLLLSMAELPGSACWKGLLPALRFFWRPTAAQAAIIPGCTATVNCSRWIAMPTEPPPHLPQCLMVFDINLSVILLFAQTKYMCEVSSRI